MAVQVPRLNRYEPQQTPSVGRSEVSVPNLAAAAQPQMNAVMNIAEQQVQYFQKQEDAAIDTAAKVAANEYQVYLNNELSKARTFKGDPTSIYSQFDEGSETKYNEILNKNPNLSSRGKTLVQQQLSEVKSNYQMQRDTAYSGQYYNYDKQVTDESAALSAQDITTMASYIDPSQGDKSFEKIDKVIRRISNLYKAHGEKFGAVTRDENGNQISTPGIDVQIGKATSDGIVSAIGVLNTSGRPDLADAMYAKYYKFIETNKQDDIKKAITEKQRTVKVLNAVESLKIISDPKKLDKEVSKIFSDDVEGKEKFYEALDARTRRDENIKKRISNKFYDFTFKHVFNKMNSAVPYSNVSEMENDEEIADTLSKLDAGDLKAVYQLVKAPPKSDFKSFAKNIDHISNNSYAGMSGTQLNKELTGLSTSDRNFFRGWHAKLNTETESQVRSRIGSAVDDLRKGLIATKAIPLDAQGNPTKKGEAKIYRLKTEFLKSSNFITKDTPLAEITKKVDDIVTKTKAKKDGSGGWWNFFNKNEEDDTGEDAKITEPTRPRSGSIYPGPGLDARKPVQPGTTESPVAGKTYTDAQILGATKAYIEDTKNTKPKRQDIIDYMIKKGM